jgi:hypothetical protein
VRIPARPAFVFIVLCLLLAASGRGGLAHASEGFIIRLGEAQALFRTTTASLRAGRPEEADPSLKRLVALWSEAAAAAKLQPPAVAARINMFPELMEGGSARLKRAAEALAQGRGDTALEELQPLKREWIGMRRAAGLYGLVECLEEASDALDAFLVLKRTPPDLTRAETRGDIIAKAAVYRFALKRCDPFAAQDIGTDPDYRRQADGIAAALDVVDSALRLRDGALLERVLTDLKTFDTQLSQRFGG